MRLAVLGDLLLDVDLVGTASRLAPDAPVPVIEDVTERARPGGAGLAALLAAGPGVDVTLVAPIAADPDGQRAQALLTGVELLALPWAGSTPGKRRILASGRPVARLDSGGAAGEVTVPSAVAELLREADGVLVADYGYGAASALLPALAAATAPVVWDPHPRGGPPVVGATMVTPNLAEAQHFCPEPAGVGVGDTIGRAARAGRTLQRRWQARAVAVTLGSRGALLTGADGAPLLVPAVALSGGDACGAGDAFAAAAAVALARGALPSEAAAAAVAAAGVFVAAGGAGAVGAPPPPSQADDLERVRARGGRIVATGGCFDLLHAGHVSTLEAARRLGDHLVVCVNDDASVARRKGGDRPLQPVADRARVLSALACVDEVRVFGEDDPTAVLRAVRPHVWVKGGDYTGVRLPEAAVLAEWGGEAVTVPYLAGRSTTTLVHRARLA